LDRQARKAAENCLKTGADTIISLDNYSIYKSPKVRAKEREGQSLALYLFFLPPDSPN
jgi:hypothetical protein